MDLVLSRAGMGGSHGSDHNAVVNLKWRREVERDREARRGRVGFGRSARSGGGKEEGKGKETGAGSRIARRLSLSLNIRRTPISSTTTTTSTSRRSIDHDHTHNHDHTHDDDHNLPFMYPIPLHPTSVNSEGHVVGVDGAGECGVGGAACAAE